MSIKLTWDTLYKVDYYNIYKSNILLDVNDLPEPIAINIETNNYLDETPHQGDNYYIISAVKNNIEKFSTPQKISTSHRYAGMWALAYASFGSDTGSVYDKDNLDSDMYNEYFSKTKNIMAYTKTYNATGNIKTTNISSKNIEANDIIGQKFKILAMAGTVVGDYGKMYIEFLDQENNILCAIKVDIADHIFGSNLMFGSTLTNAINIPSYGPYPSANGFLDIYIDKITYTHSNPDASSKYLDYTYNVNLSNLYYLRISQLGAHQPRMITSTGNPTGGRAGVYLQLL